eukprot:103224-Heterocapsa_arctica.AAC.1
MLSKIWLPSVLFFIAMILPVPSSPSSIILSYGFIASAFICGFSSIHCRHSSSSVLVMSFILAP